MTHTDTWHMSKPGFLRYAFLCIALFFSLAGYTQYTRLHDFDGSNGYNPESSLIFDGTSLYGMTTFGGTPGVGTIFKIQPDGSGYTKLHDFDVDNGRNPHGSLIFDGTSLYGMVGRIWPYADRLIVFKIQPDGSGYTRLLDFTGGDGANPYGSLILAGTSLYGMTGEGGTNGYGIVFKIQPDGSGYTKLHDFNGSNGGNPYGSLIFDGTWLYGMTYRGGTNNSGVIFKIRPDGSGYTRLLDFGGSNGSSPRGSLIFDGTSLYGMTSGGGTNGYGVVFKIQPDGDSYTRLLDFDGINGRNPYGSLILAGTSLYGMTREGGTNGYGVVFKIQPDGSGYTRLLDFDGINGRNPYGSLILAGTSLYGMTKEGGTNNSGVIFKYDISDLLPLQLLSFTARENTDCTATLQWATAGEVNVSHFEVEASEDGKVFAPVAVRPSVAGGAYSIPLPLKHTTTYFRLKAVDLDGSYTYSKTISLQSYCGGRQISVFPNPAGGKAHITGAEAGSTYILYDNSGNTIGKGAAESENHEIDMSGMQPGVYYLLIDGKRLRMVKE